MQPSILVVDHEPAVAAFVSDILQQQGYHVETATHERDAMRLLKTLHFDALLLDLELGMGSVDILSWVKEQQPQLETVIMTSYGSALRGITQNYYDYLLKPFRGAGVILSVVRRISQGLAAPQRCRPRQRPAALARPRSGHSELGHILGLRAVSELPVGTASIDKSGTRRAAKNRRHGSLDSVGWPARFAVRTVA